MGTTEYKNIVVSLAARLGNFVGEFKKAGDAATGAFAQMAGGEGGLKGFLELGETALHARVLVHATEAVTRFASSAVSALRGDWEKMYESWVSMPIAGPMTKGFEELGNTILGTTEKMAKFAEEAKAGVLLWEGTGSLNEMSNAALARFNRSMPGWTADDEKSAQTDREHAANVLKIDQLKFAHKITPEQAKDAYEKEDEAYWAEVAANSREVTHRLSTEYQKWVDAMEADFQAEVDRIENATRSVIGDANRAAFMSTHDAIEGKLYDLNQTGATGQQLDAAALALVMAKMSEDAAKAQQGLADFAALAKDELKTADDRLGEYVQQVTKATEAGLLSVKEGNALDERKRQELFPDRSAQGFGILGSQMSLDALAGSVGKDDRVADNTAKMIPVLQSIDKQLSEKGQYWAD